MPSCQASSELPVTGKNNAVTSSRGNVQTVPSGMTHAANTVAIVYVLQPHWLMVTKGLVINHDYLQVVDWADEIWCGKKEEGRKVEVYVRSGHGISLCRE